MRRRWVVLVLFAFTVLMVLFGWNWQRQQHISPAIAIRPAQVSHPSINADRVLADLNALSVERYTDADRERSRTYIMEQLQAAGWTVQQHKFSGGINLYADRPGTDANAGMILLGAHYDTVSRSPGADDNATAVAAVLETARVLGQQATPRSLRLILFDAEERGLIGSEAYVQDIARSQPPTGAVILDMIGYACHEAGCQTYPEVLPIKPDTDRGDFLGVIGDQGHPLLIDSFTQTHQFDLPPLQTLSVPTFGRFTPDLVRSDHAPFWRAGMGAVLVTDTANFRNPHYHQPSDTVETIDPRFFLGSVQQIVNAIEALLR